MVNQYLVRTIICLQCEKIVTKRQPKHRMFCSSKCASIFNMNKKRNGFLRKCLMCDNLIYINPSQSKTKKFCSRKCVGIYNTKVKTGENAYNYKGGSCIDPIKFKEYKAFKERRRNFQKRTSEKTHTLQEWKDLKEKYNYTCLKCFKREPEIKLTEDHIIPISLDGHDGIDNIQPMCISCNSKKHNKIQDYRNRIIYIE